MSYRSSCYLKAFVFTRDVPVLFVGLLRLIHSLLTNI